MRSLLLLVVAAASFGCAHTRYIRPPDTAPIRATIAEATVANVEQRAAIRGAQSAIKQAIVGAAELLRVAPLDLRPQVEALQGQLTQATQELATAEARTDTLQKLFRTAASNVDALQTSVNKLTEETITAQTAAEKATAAKHIADAKALKWMCYFWGLTALIAAFFVARQYLPFLKFI